MTNPNYLIEVSDLHKSFGELKVLKGVSEHISKGEVVSIIGPSGGGKSTFLRCLNLLEIPDSGKILFEGEDIFKNRRARKEIPQKIQMIFQDPYSSLNPAYTVAWILEEPLRIFGKYDAAERRRRVREMLDRVGLPEECLAAKPAELSGGQRQAMALLMSTMTPIEFLILDEHTAALDPKTAEIIMELTDQVVKEKHLTTIMVTHNLRYAVEYGSRLIMMHQGEAIMDKGGEEKKVLRIEEILDKFNEISVECGN